jgi:uncharacterized protein (DUF934 family)
MRRIIRRREVVADALAYPGEAAPEGALRVLVLADWLVAAAAGAGVSGDLAAGVLLGPTDDVALLAPHLGRIRLVVIEFPKLAEGRGYSQGRLLRARYGYEGELRARGVIKRDQLYLLARCGFDAFELDPGEDPEGALAAFQDFSVATQDGSARLVAPRQRTADGTPATAPPPPR